MKTSLRRETVQHILKHGERHAWAGQVVCVLRSGDCSGKFSILISKKVIKGAVARNSMRRALREAVRHSGFLGGDFVVLHGNKSISETEAAEQLKRVLAEIAGA